MKISEQLAIQRLYSAQASGKPKLSPDFSREAIEGMGKDDLVEMLAAHGVKASRRKSEATLRAELIALIFVDL